MHCLSCCLRALLAMLTVCLPLTAATAAGTVNICGLDFGPVLPGTNIMDFQTAMTGGGRVVIDCPPGSVIHLTHAYTVSASTSIETLHPATLDADGARMFVGAGNDVRLSISGITLRNAQLMVPTGNPAYSGTVVSGPITVEMTHVNVVNTRHPIDVDALVISDSNFSGNVGSLVRADVFEATHTTFTCGVPSSIGFEGDRTVRFDDVTIVGCGELWSKGDTIVKNSHFIGSHLKGKVALGGALAVIDGTAEVSTSTFYDNSSVAGGGAIFLSGGTLNLRRVNFESNSSTGPWAGGAILAAASSSSRNTVLQMTYVKFIGNAALNGGAIAVWSAPGGASLVVSGDAVMFDKNTAFSGGGALSITGGAVSLSRAIFVENKAARGGALLQENDVSVQLANALFARNEGNGAAFFGSSLTLMNSTVAGSRGAALVAAHGGAGLVRLKNSIIANNPEGNCRFRSSQVRVEDDGNNLQSRDASCGASIPVVDPLLDAQFYVPLPGSPARRAGDNAACISPPVAARDVYGGVRPQGDRCTIGAVEGTVSAFALRQLRAAPGDQLSREFAELRRKLWPSLRP